MHYSIREGKPQDRDEFINILSFYNMHHAFLKDEHLLDYQNFFVAVQDGKILGFAGFIQLTPTRFRTRLLAVYPEFKGSGLGKHLQELRLEKMYQLGAKIVETIADADFIVLWYKKHFGYKEIGTVKKTYENSLKEKTHAIVLEMNLEEYMRNKKSTQQQKEHFIRDNEPHPLSPYSPLIINVALTGVVPTKLLNQHTPISPNEIIEDAIRVANAGASIVHLHVRDEQGQPINDARLFEEVITGIRKESPELICCVSTSGRGGQSFETRSEVLYLQGSAKPDMASLSLGSMNFLNAASVNDLETIQRLAILMKDQKIKPELEIFDTGMINVAKYLQRHQLLDECNYFNILLGNLNTAAATLKDLAHIYTSLPDNSIWAVAGLGQFQLPMNMASIIAGGHVRVGLEDNVYYDMNKRVLATNEMLVNRVVNIANELQREIAQPKQTREMLKL